MSARSSRRDNARFADIEGNDGVQNMDLNTPGLDGAVVPPYYPPPPKVAGTRTDKYIPSYIREDRERAKSRPESESPETDRPRQTRYRSPSPPRRSSYRPSHDRPRDRPRDRIRDHVRDHVNSSSQSSPHRDADHDSRTGRPSLRKSQTAPPPSAASPPRRRRGHSASPARHHDRRPGPPSPGRRSSPDGKPRAPVKRSKTSISYEEVLRHPRFQNAAAAALKAGSATALKLRSAPGSWSGGKGVRVAGAAIGAAAIDALRTAEPGKSSSDRKSSDGARGGGGMSTAGSAIGGFLIEQLLAKGGSGRSSQKKGRKA